MQAEMAQAQSLVMERGLVGYNRSRIIHPEIGTEPEPYFLLTRTGTAFNTSGSGSKETDNDL